MIHSFNTEVAELCGINAATIFYNISYWVYYCETNKTNFVNGKYWAKNSNCAFAKQFPYLSEKQIRNSISKLEEKGLIVKSVLSEDPMDRTSWFSLTDKGYELSSWSNSECAFAQNGKWSDQEGKSAIYIKYNNNENNEDSLEDNKLSSRSSSFVQPMDDQWTTNGQPMDCIGKDSIGEDSIGEVIIYHEESSNKLPKTANQKGTNTKKTEFIPPTLEEIEEYISAENIANVNAKKFFDHYSDPDRNWRDGKGKKMSNWKLTVRTWSRNDFGSSNQAMTISSNLSKAEQEYAAWGAEQDRILQEKAEKKMNQRKHDDCPF